VKNKTICTFEKVFKIDSVIKYLIQELEDVPVEVIELGTESTGRE